LKRRSNGAGSLIESVVSTGTSTDRFQKRNGQWKCLERTSNVDPNWPAWLFQTFVDNEKLAN
jgi:hypothetical protein